MDNNVLRFNTGSKLIMAFALLILGFGGLLFFTLERFVSLQESEELQFKKKLRAALRGEGVAHQYCGPAQRPVAGDRRGYA